MRTDRHGATRAAFAAMLLTSAAPAFAQDAPGSISGIANSAALQDPAATTPTPIPVPDAPRIVLPTATPPSTPASRTKPAPQASAPVAKREPAPEARPTTRAAAPVADVLATPTPTPAPTPSLTPAPAPTAASVAQPTPQPVPTLSAPAVSEPTVSGPTEGRTMPFWLWLAVIVVVVAALWFLRRNPARRTSALPAPDPVAPDPVAEAPQPIVDASVATTTSAPKFLEPRTSSAPPVMPEARARLAIELRPKRAGLNLLSATAECEIVVTNTGDAPASGIRAQATLLTAHAGQDADLAAINAAPIVRPAVPPFALAPGESRSVRTVAATPREAIHSLMAGDRPMFVPIVAVNILYDSGDLRGHTAGAWAIGVERVDSAKLAPFWLDGPARMFDAIGARAHAAAVER